MDASQRCPQVVRHAVGKGFELGIEFGEFLGALLDAMLQSGGQLMQLFLAAANTPKQNNDQGRSPSSIAVRPTVMSCSRSNIGRRGSSTMSSDRATTVTSPVSKWRRHPAVRQRWSSELM